MTIISIKFKIIILMILGSIPLLYFPTQETFEKEVALKNGQAVKLELKFADEINIKTWNKQQLYIKATVKHNFKEKLNYQLLEFNETDEVEIEEKIKNFEERKNINIGGKSKEHNRNCIEIDIDYEVYLPANVELVINSISGNIDVKSMNNSLTLETITGFVDVSIDPSKKYDLKCSTISGSIYSNLNFDSNGNIKADIVGSKLNTRLNGGGKTLRIKSISGDLYIRKR